MVTSEPGARCLRCGCRAAAAHSVDVPCPSIPYRTADPLCITDAHHRALTARSIWLETAAVVNMGASSSGRT
jgi:hypothetical protein